MQIGEGNYNYRHGGTFKYKKEYNSWRAMKERCNNKNYRCYNRYGGRGISYCKRWESFANFLEDMGERPNGYTLDRIDNNGDYCPENCRWANQKDQVKNSIIKTGAKVTKEMVEMAVCSQSVLYKRVRAGWTVEDAMYTPAENQYMKARELALARHRECPVCGKKCPHVRDKYCCKEHFRMSRGADGKFTKGVQNVKEQEVKETQQTKAVSH